MKHLQILTLIIERAHAAGVADAKKSGNPKDFYLFCCQEEDSGRPNNKAHEIVVETVAPVTWNRYIRKAEWAYMEGVKMACWNL